MRPTLRLLAGVAALGAAVCAATPGFTQAPPPGPPPPPYGDQAHWAEHMREHDQARAAALHDILRIRPDQDAAFQAFIASMRPPEGHDDHQGMGGPHDKDDMEGLTTPQMLDRMTARMAERQAAFERHAAAVKAFYGVLSPEQQRAFDALHRMMGEGHHGPWGGPGHFGGHDD